MAEIGLYAAAFAAGFIGCAVGIGLRQWANNRRRR